jgi:hypothetical protein
MKDIPRKAVNIFTFDVFKRIVKRTAINTGAARQNWNLTINGENYNSDPNKTTSDVLKTEGAVIDSANGNDTIFIQHFLSYIRALEFRRRKPVKNSVKSTPESRSLQAPGGMVRVVLSKADQVWERAVNGATEHHGC